MDRLGNNPTRLVIVGAGEQAEIAYEYFTADSPHEVVAFAVERALLSETSLYGLPVVALEELAERYPPAAYDAFVAISAQRLNRVRRRLFNLVKRQGYTCVSFVSPHAFVWSNVVIGENCFIFEGVVLQHHVVIGDNCLLWSGTHVAHRSAFEEDVATGPCAVVSGFSRIGARSFLGANSTVANDLTVAPDTVIGAGAVVPRAIATPRGVHVGSPARPTGRDSFELYGIDR